LLLPGAGGILGPAVSQENTSLSKSSMSELLAQLRGPNKLVMQRYPLETGRRQPVHTVYGGAHLFKSDSAVKLGAIALRTMDEYAADPFEFAAVTGIDAVGDLARAIHERVRAKLEREPVEDFRIDFEDGYGNRADDEEDGHARAAALEVVKGMAAGTLSPFIGIRIKPLSEELAPRSLRTLDLFVTTVVRETGGKLPDNFVITLPKITAREQIVVLCQALGELERALGLSEKALPIEFMVETTQSILDADGGANLPRFLDAAGGRCVAAHFGTYDYTASCNITAAHQHMRHPACDFAKHMMQVAYSGRGIWLSDGATTIMPVAVHRAEKGGPGLSSEQLAENRKSVHDAWRLHVTDIKHSLVHGYYQGWDLHPGQLVTRYAAVFAFFLEGLPAASLRLKNFVARAAQATLVGDVFDDAATGQGLLNFFLRGINCGAFGEDEALATGLTVEELRGRSFVQILKNRRAGAPRSA
jgi:citrate lyase beta subunit